MGDIGSTEVWPGGGINGTDSLMILRSLYFALAGAPAGVPPEGPAPAVSTRTLLFGATPIWPATMTFSPAATPWVITMFAPCRWPKVTSPRSAALSGFTTYTQGPFWLI